MKTPRDITSGRYKRHILLCADQSKPKCAPTQITNVAWTKLKDRLDELDLSRGEDCVFRSKVNCLRVCEKGPIAVVYPDGTWYHSASGDVLERILVEHLQNGKPVEKYILARNPLSVDQLQQTQSREPTPEDGDQC